MFDATPKLDIQVSNGSIRLHSSPNEHRISLVWQVRCQDRTLAALIRPAFSKLGHTTTVAFVVPADNRHALSVDVDLFLPNDIECDARTSMGNIIAAQISASCKLRTSMGRISVSLTESWKGDQLAFSSRMGNISVKIPKALHLALTMHTSMGSVKSNVSSYKDGAKLDIRSSMGNISLQSA
ncbi:MAG: DUF4097 family beta strand repeat protein [Candidatus Eremiobacteraeota bacterium]|nr:DUF4097 family beta strand repeat protein [Candidatus Eremiobacteraeota bacterium]